MSDIKFSIHKECPYCSFQKILAYDYRNQTCLNCGLKIMENGISYDLIIELP